MNGYLKKMKGWTTPASLLAGMAVASMMIISSTTIYWWFYDTKAPLTVQYRHPKFLAVGVASLEDAKKYELDVVPAGATVFVYEESCRSTAETGRVFRAFVGDYVFSLPMIETTSVKGCANRSYAVKAPTQPGVYEYNVRIVYPKNPMRDVTVVMEPIVAVVK